jgi:ribosomal protein S18 acetylase RimI-like enzyme
MVSTSPIHIRAYTDDDFEHVVALWHACGLLRPWNEPNDDIALCRRTASSELFVGLAGDNDDAIKLVATVMTGSDGHRGWMYYLAVDPTLRHKGFGRAMVRHAENWLAALGIRKVELMIRDDNEAVRSFYDTIGYAVEPRVIMSRWLTDKK